MQRKEVARQHETEIVLNKKTRNDPGFLVWFVLFKTVAVMLQVV
ncbi:hypothetical protein [Ferruginibacter sp.]|nr:hypothetical protein [Ferruginibacter sp.]